MAHIISSCSKLAGTEDTQKHNNVTLIVYRAICAENSKNCWVEPEKVVRNDHAKIFLNFPIQDKKLKKIDKYKSLKIELEQLWKVKIMVIPVVVGALGAIADRSVREIWDRALLGIRVSHRKNLYRERLRHLSSRSMSKISLLSRADGWQQRYGDMTRFDTYKPLGGQELLSGR